MQAAWVRGSHAWPLRPTVLAPGLPAGLDNSAVLESLPGKQPLIKLSYRPPNYESPLEYFTTPITPNDRFYVRYHLSDIPDVDERTYRIAIGGDGANRQVEIAFDELKAFPTYEVVAVNQCSGNRRGLSKRYVPGVQWGYGAMGCARWKGARLKDLLDKVDLRKEAIEIAFDGADGPPLDKAPDFIKSLPVWKAIEESTLVAYEMNGEPLAHFNGYPARSPLGGFWMNQAYRLPAGQFPQLARFVTQENASTVPVTEMVVNSLITSPTAPK